MELQEIITSKKDELYESFEAVCQPRSDYQIKHFVVGDHTTPERQYLQAVVEMQAKVNNLRRAAISRRKLLKKWHDEEDPDDKEMIAIELEELELSVKGAVREFNVLYSLYAAMPKFTAAQIQAAEEGYWRERLIRQATIDAMATGRIGAGNLNALRQADGLPALEADMRRLKANLQGQDVAPGWLEEAG